MKKNKFMMKKNIAGFDLSQTKCAKLKRILDSRLDKVLADPSDSSNHIYWDAGYFNLDNSTVFQNATLQQKKDILKVASRELLEEAYFIEKAGMGYMAKMVLLSETTEERMLYSLFAADETTHLAKIMPFLERIPVDTDDLFLQLLGDVVESDDKSVILFVLQVVLEGWGLSHYRSLAKGCGDRDLSFVFRSFLDDESRHHATGVTLFQQQHLDLSSKRAIVEILASFLEMIRVGPQRVLNAVEMVLGDLSRSQKIKLFEELDTESHSSSRLSILRSLIGKEGSIFVTELEEKGLFSAYQNNWV
ncbi:MAG: ferritin-like domain-containing protein [Okeania sp. SIO2D1]|nr:ferritin-like domain-containing protein [Okeania sp. SIO2D1]